MLKEAIAPYTKKNSIIECRLCPRYCKLRLGQIGACRVRKNIDGKLYSLNYGMVTAMAVDPIEKKPLYHFWPGAPIFSISTFPRSTGSIFWRASEMPTTLRRPSSSVRSSI
ncbi:MAG: hypothetical protein ACP6IU_13325 [Candidatus Asgardarchaeia archaeon]